MGSRTTALAAALSAAALVAALAGCASAGAHAQAAPSTATPTATPVVVHGTGITVGAKAQPAPTTLTVSAPTWAHSIEITVTCPGTGGWFVSDDTSSLTRHGQCGTATSLLLPVAHTAAEGADHSLVASAATGGAQFSVQAVATSREFHQNADLAAFCRAYGKPDSTLYNADLSLKQHLSTSSQWQAARASGASQLEALTTLSAPAWATADAAAIRTAVLAAPLGASDTADETATQQVADGCENNDSTVTVTESGPGQG